MSEVEGTATSKIKSVYRQIKKRQTDQQEEKINKFIFKKLHVIISLFNEAFMRMDLVHLLC